jgi:hypothetical protein
MYVCEGSHCGIVPMNHSNKDGTSSAESEEGRLRIKENAGQSNTCPTQSGEACVSQGLTGVRTSGLLCFGRYSSEIRTGCANERPSGSVRGAPGDWCPCRDRQRPHSFRSRLATTRPESARGSVFNFAHLDELALRGYDCYRWQFLELIVGVDPNGE